MLYILYILYYKSVNWEEAFVTIRIAMNNGGAWQFILCIILMPFNWFIEACKWQLSIKEFTEISIRNAFRGIIQGISFGIITPARVGEYGGRALVLPQKYVNAGVWGTLLCSLTQNIFNIGVGLTVLIYSYFTYLLEDQLLYHYVIILTSVLFVLLIIGIIYFKQIYLIGKNVKILSFIYKLTDASYFNEITFTKLSKITLLSGLRYSIYLGQFILLFRAIGIEVPLHILCMGLVTVFMLQTIMPLTPIIKFGVRGSLFIFVFNSFAELANVSSNDEALFATGSYILWIINLMIPALTGVILLFYSNKLNSKAELS